MVLYDDFTTAEEAKRFFEWKSGRAFKVLKKTTKTDAKGKTIEYHAELVPEDDHSEVEVMWVVGVSVHMVRARSLEDARAFCDKMRGM